MSSIDKLSASLREKVGTNSAKKVRIANKIPAIFSIEPLGLSQ